DKVCLYSELLKRTSRLKFVKIKNYSNSRKCYNVCKMPKPKDGKQKKITGSGAEGGATGPNSTSNPVILQSDNSIAIRILAKPGAKQNGITGLTSEGVGVQISAPPVEGEANTELVKYISKVLGVRKSDLQLDKVF
ncbi:unnamed protein product, partial [Lymnaea stagnalis]